MKEPVVKVLIEGVCGELEDEDEDGEEDGMEEEEEEVRNCEDEPAARSEATSWEYYNYALLALRTF